MPASVRILLGLAIVNALIGCEPVAAPPEQAEASAELGASPVADAPTPTAASPSAAASSTTGALTPENTKIEFVGTKKDGSHTGGFARFSGKLAPAGGDFAASTLTVEIDAESLFSDDPKLTNHLKAPDFFEVKKYPDASFASTKIEAGGADGATHTIQGELTLHGTTKPVAMPAKVSVADDVLSLDSTFRIDRTEFGIAYKPEAVDPIVTIKVTSKVIWK